MSKYEKLVYVTDPRFYEEPAEQPFISIQKAVISPDADNTVAGIWSDDDESLAYAELFSRAPILLDLVRDLSAALEKLDTTDTYIEIRDLASKHLSELGMPVSKPEGVDTPFADGHRAFWNYYDINDNPYDVNLERKQFYRWEDGFIAARAISRNFNGDE